MQILKGYKNTKIGTIPEDWDIKNLEEVCNTVRDGSHFSPRHQDSGYPLATVTNMKENYIDIDSCYHISKDDFDLLVKNGCKLNYNDVLFSKDGTVGLSLVYNQNEPLVVLSSIAIIRPIPSLLDNYYTKYVLQSDLILSKILGARTGTALKRIILRDLRKITIPIPSLQEQQKIVSILSNVDELIQKIEQIIEQTQRLKKGLVQRLLTKGIGHTKFKKVALSRSNVKLGQIPNEWEVKNSFPIKRESSSVEPLSKSLIK